MPRTTTRHSGGSAVADGKGKARRAASQAKRKGRSLADRITERLPGPAGRIVETARSNDVLLYSAGLAFYALISLVPLAIVVVWVTSLVLGDDRLQQFARQVERAAPENLQAGRLLEQVAEVGTSLGVAAVVVALWPATSYGAGLRRAFHDLSPQSGREMEGLRGRGLTLLVLLPLFVLGSLLASYAGTSLVGDGVLAGFLGAALALVLGFVMTAAGTALIYRIFPPKRMAWGDIGFGVLWASTTIALLSLAFTLFLSFGANFQDHYGTSGMAALVLLGLWLFLANVLLLVGFRLAQDR